MLTAFTPVEALVGGSLIGASAVALMALNGRIAGMTGMLLGVVLPSLGDKGWRIAFLLGAIVAPILIWSLTGRPIPFASDIPAWQCSLAASSLVWA